MQEIKYNVEIQITLLVNITGIGKYWYCINANKILTEMPSKQAFMAGSSILL